jgi:hypothetical protein
MWDDLDLQLRQGRQSAAEALADQLTKVGFQGGGVWRQSDGDLDSIGPANHLLDLLGLRDRAAGFWVQDGLEDGLNVSGVDHGAALLGGRNLRFSVQIQGFGVAIHHAGKITVRRVFAYGQWKNRKARARKTIPPRFSSGDSIWYN